MLAMSLMLRLSYHGRVKELVPASLATILPPAPQITLPGDPAQPSNPSEGQANGAGPEAVSEAAVENGDGDGDAMAVDAGAASNGDQGSHLQRWVTHILELVGAPGWQTNNLGSCCHLLGLGRRWCCRRWTAQVLEMHLRSLAS